MKTQLLCFAFAGLFFYSAQATVRTVSNAPLTTLAQFNTINAAIGASSNGDTILVNGSSVNYAAFSLSNKRLTIIGPGWAPDKVNPLTAVVLGCAITGTGCSGSEIQGFVFAGAVAINSNKPDSMRFIRNRFSNSQLQINAAGSNYKDYIFEGNYFDWSSSCCDVAVILANTSSTYQNFLFQNNVFFSQNSGNIGSAGGHINSFNNGFNTVLFDHNVFYGPAASNNTEAFINCGFMLMTNNIFNRRNVNVNNTVFSNNITFNISNTPWTINGNSDGGGNFSGVDPQMASQATINTGNQNNALLDFSIAAGPANNAGSDGKDIGLLYDAVGSLNWANSRNSRLPRIFNMTITNPVNPAGGTLNITIDGRKSN